MSWQGTKQQQGPARPAQHRTHFTFATPKGTMALARQGGRIWQQFQQYQALPGHQLYRLLGLLAGWLAAPLRRVRFAVNVCGRVAYGVYAFRPVPCFLSKLPFVALWSEARCYTMEMCRRGPSRKGGRTWFN